MVSDFFVLNADSGRYADTLISYTGSHRLDETEPN